MKSISFFVAIILSSVQVYAFVDGNGPIVGGISNAPPDNYHIVVPTMLALEREMDGKMNSPFVHRVNKIKDLKTQVVAGIRYYVKFDFGQTSCLKNATNAVGIAQCNDVTKIHKCEADIWEQAWIDKRDLLNFKCN
ncbi:cystatin-C-like protein [Euroglyphus maynei]|uniref:Cystatin-C-like protein n=1 Tax=Euroglyphus maynei TaxID=6958 RepID=A0A1Y3BPV7_EURMA|nr:cystatin-C-like protein [Euroglyphus maynei]